MKKKLFLLDGMALIYRAYFAFNQNPRITSNGFNTSAAFGFTNTLLDVLKKEKPTHLGISFDTGVPTERHIIYEKYKAHREAMPEDLKSNIPYIFKIIEAFNIPMFNIDGYEADDVLGTLAKMASKRGFETYLMTPDKDFGQLVEKDIFIYKPPRMGNAFEILGVNEILKKWEIDSVEKVIEILGLWGDASDNIPGVPGIGEVTAKKLIQQFGTIENLLKNTDMLKGKLQENIIKFSEQALLSKNLATINTNVPIEFDENSLEINEPDFEKIKKIFAELEFKTLANRVLGSNLVSVTEIKLPTSYQTDLFGNNTIENNAENNATETVQSHNISNVKHHYILVKNDQDFNNLLNEFKKNKSFCFDTETTGLNVLSAEIVGLSIAFIPGTAWYLPFNENKNLSIEKLNKLKPFFENENIEKIGQNIKYDLAILKNYGITLKGKLFDTMLAHYLLEPDQKHGMDFLSEKYLNYTPVSITELIGKKGKDQLNFREVELEKAKEYSCEDADITLQLSEIFKPLLKKEETESVLFNIEMPLVPVLESIEREGVAIDVNTLSELSVTLQAEANNIEKEIYNLAGVKFNISSPKQLGEILFDNLKLDPKAKKTKTGQYQTGEEILMTLTNIHPLPLKVLDFREVQKLKSTYVDALPLLINKQTGRVHTSFNQAVAATGRLSSNYPNLQNIPIKTDKGKEIRKAFIPRNNNNILLSADYSQIELRIIASISGDKNMIEAFNNNIDIHTATASKVWNIPVEKVDSAMRRKAKTVNFGIIYGISSFGLSQRVGISRTEAKQIIDNYFENFNGIKKYMDEQIAFCKKFGFVKTLSGRRRYIRDINSSNHTVAGFAERNAINAPIQGTAADMIKLAMIDVFNRLSSSKFDSKMILQVHDELLFDVPKSELENVIPIIKTSMENALKLKVPVVVEIGYGKNWLEAH
ncbi:MAG: DNA polymerase I [Bacteroidetes bacterium]|nr:DNA polymerase I [Bacteroidota bacterium]